MNKESILIKIQHTCASAQAQTQSYTVCHLIYASSHHLFHVWQDRYAYVWKHFELFNIYVQECSHSVTFL